MMDITVRHIEFDLALEKPVEVEVIPGDPEMSYFMVGFSMITPYLEPYLVKQSLEGQKHVTDDDIRKDMRQFCRQEAQHYKAHAKFNERVRAMYPALEKLEKEVAEDYARFATKGLKWNLAYAEGFESFTGPFVIYMWESGMLKSMVGTLGDMWRWHFMEECEHRTVTFDAYHHLYGDKEYWYRTRIGLYAQFHLIRFMYRCAACMLESERHLFRQRGGYVGRLKRVWKWVKLGNKHLFPLVSRIYRRGYTPRSLVLPVAVMDLVAHYNARAHKVEPNI